MADPTLIELLSRVGKIPLSLKCVLALYVLSREGAEAPTTADVRDALAQARVPGVRKTNLSAALGRAGSLVDRRRGIGGKVGWALTDQGRAEVSELTGVPIPEESQEDVSSLQAVASRVTDEAERDYLTEAIDCLRVHAFRACVLMVWQAAVARIQGLVLAEGPSSIDTELSVLDPKARRVRSNADFGYVKESTLIDLAHRLGIFDKGQKQELHKALDLRNRCGHPGKYRPGEKKVSAFLEDVVSIVLT